MFLSSEKDIQYIILKIFAPDKKVIFFLNYDHFIEHFAS